MMNGDLAAFPGEEEWAAIDLTKREYFAALAMQGLLAHHGAGSTKFLAANAVGMADALIAALNGKEEAKPGDWRQREGIPD